MNNIDLSMETLTTGSNQPMTLVFTREQVELLASLIEVAVSHRDCDRAGVRYAMLTDILGVMETEYLQRIGGGR